MRTALYFIIALSILSVSCRSVKETKALQDCTYTFSNISDIMVNGVSIRNQQGLRDLQTQDAAKISQALMARRIPVHFTAHIAIHNPNSKLAALNNLDWKLLLRNNKVAEGTLSERFEIGPNETIIVPIEVSTDIGSVMGAFSMKELTTLMFNMQSVQKIAQDVELKIRPSLKVGKASIKSPAFFTVNASL